MNLTVSLYSANCSSEFERPSGLSGVDPLGVMAGRMLTSLLRRVTDGLASNDTLRPPQKRTVPYDDGVAILFQALHARTTWRLAVLMTRVSW